MPLSTAYFPPIDWFSAFWQSDLLLLEACEHHQKGGMRNRCHIAGPNGLQLLSIPLEKGKHQQTPIKEVRISYADPWQRQHWRSIKTAYGNAPFFEHYEAEIQALLAPKHAFLFDLNLEIIQFLLKKWAWKGQIEHTSTWQASKAEPPRRPLPYPQVFMERHGFLPNLSALDLLMCCGKMGVSKFQV